MISAGHAEDARLEFEVSGTFRPMTGPIWRWWWKIFVQCGFQGESDSYISGHFWYKPPLASDVLNCMLFIEG